ncbi:MAG TPA: DUF3276 family protein [Chitinophagales bacterium]|nr:DUF3276 family protein [Chitinophagales bacterium]HNM31885.1 DUF3276 family protein [Chitinophagales bacterium]
MENEKNFDKNGVYSKRVRAGKRRTYFFDVRTTRGNDYYLTITESKKRADDDSYERHKIFIYKEDFVKFVNAMQETVDYIKTDLLPDYDFDAHNHDYDDENGSDDEPKHSSKASETTPETPPAATGFTPKPTTDEAEKWD